MKDIFKYKEKDLLGGWSIEVRKGSRIIGNIRKNQLSGKFQYYPGVNNILTIAFEEYDLDVLKQKIETSV